MKDARGEKRDGEEDGVDTLQPAFPLAGFLAHICMAVKDW